MSIIGNPIILSGGVASERKSERYTELTMVDTAR